MTTWKSETDTGERHHSKVIVHGRMACFEKLLGLLAFHSVNGVSVIEDLIISQLDFFPFFISKPLLTV